MLMGIHVVLTETTVSLRYKTFERPVITVPYWYEQHFAAIIK